MKLAGRVALVTGATGSLGHRICLALAAQGASIVVGYNQSAEKAQQVLDSLPEVEQGHLLAAAPVTNSAALADLASQIQQHFGRCDMVVNCAGTTRFVEHADLASLEDALIDTIFTTNVRGAIAVVRALQPLLQQSDDGLIVNISSIAARTAMGSNIAYCASKAALDNLTISLARALAPKIRVVSVAPGLSDTEFVKGLDQDWRNLQAQSTPLGRLALPEEVAAAVVAVATQLTFTTGAIIPVDGGRQIL
ncbi:SDR family oxidoreductase [Acinetobacter nosocomialis]|uniref:SDR family NAD(P)-dependent oxidoreductase n=1 Tax=Acinetobacter TaxID=469 RepID=UPI000B3DF9C2|nr:MULTISPECIES: SDR family oxidoreductase [Acinetobacter]MCZ2961428.1 SDR family oxidoreductase [Acinetobacter baumannii]MCZ3210821.1 SDR family oxidoreductase [Acinetobacter baumannii]MCZ3293479.1 SDR family oxidoreductase [Acinetobacter baumannii]MDQ9042461.1 SDR family oxidoreductase [Acinetobacter nosocomialis]MDQ9905753.1 SDR family oxidoreductase [Acinetobacter sp. 148]